MDPLSITTSVTALLGATTLVIQYLIDVREGGKERRKLEEEVTGLLIFLQSLRASALENEADADWFKGYQKLVLPGGALEQLYAEIAKLSSKIKPAESGLKGLRQQLSWNFEKAEVYRTIDRIARLKTDVDLILGQDHFALSLQIRSDGQVVKDGVFSLKEAHHGNCSFFSSWCSLLIKDWVHLQATEQFSFCVLWDLIQQRLTGW